MILFALFTFQFVSVAETKNGDPFIDKAMKAISEGDYETIEGLRGYVKVEHIPQLVKTWNKNLDWTQKDGFILLLMDQKGDILKPLMKDGLDSPTIENRAAALCVLLQKPDVCTSFFDKSGWVVEKKVSEEVAKYKKANP